MVPCRLSSMHAHSCDGDVLPITAARRLGRAFALSTRREDLVGRRLVQGLQPDAESAEGTPGPLTSSERVAAGVGLFQNMQSKDERALETKQRKKEEDRDSQRALTNARPQSLGPLVGLGGGGRATSTARLLFAPKHICACRYKHEKEASLRMWRLRRVGQPVL